MAVRSRAPNIVIACCIATDEKNKATTQSTSLQDNIAIVPMRTPVHRASMPSEIAPTAISNTLPKILIKLMAVMRNIVKELMAVMRKVVAIELMAVRLAVTITLETNIERKAVISIGATVAVLNIVLKVTKIVKVAKVFAILQLVVIDTVELHRADSKMRMAEGEENTGTPSAIMQTLANTKYSTGIAKESCKR